MRILQVAPALDMGGLERIVADIAIELHGTDVTAVAAPSSGHFASLLLQRGVTVFGIHAPGRGVGSQLRCVCSLASVLRRFRPDVIHVHNPAAALATRLAAAVVRTAAPIVATYHGVSAREVSRAASILDRSASIVVACGDGAAEELRMGGVRSGKLTVVSNGVRVPSQRSFIRQELALDSSHQLLVSVGRYVPQKNQTLLLAAMAALRERRPNLRLVLVGKGPLEVELEAEIRRLGLADRAFLAGPRADATAIIADADLFVSSSVWEGLPLVILEAMVVGTPVVTTPVHGIHQLVRHLETGFVAAGSGVDDFVRAVELALDCAEIPEIRAAAQRTASNYTLEEMIRRYERVYVDALEQQRGRARRQALSS